MDKTKKKKVLAVASAGGHWIELLRIRPAFNPFHVVYVSTNKGNVHEVQGYEFHHIANATRRSFYNFFVMFFQLLGLILKIRPKVIVTTGSAPGLMALAVGKLCRVKTVWIESISSVDEPSTSGKNARFFADLYLTQWEHLEKEEGPKFKGTIL